MHKGSCKQNFVPWTVHVWGWLKRIGDQGVRTGGRLVPVLGTDAHLLGVCTYVQGYLRGYACVSVYTNTDEGVCLCNCRMFKCRYKCLDKSWRASVLLSSWMSAYFCTLLVGRKL